MTIASKPSLSGAVSASPQTKRTFLLDGDAACREIGSPKVLNMVMLGAVLRSDVLPLTLEEVTETMERTVKPQFRELNRKALHIQG